MARPRALLLASVVLALACEERRAPPAAPAPLKPPVFTVRDLALATAVDACVARVALAAGDLEEAFVGVRSRGAAPALLGPLEVARAELAQAARAVTHPIDRPFAQDVAARADAYARELATFANGGAAASTVASARNAFGDAAAIYHHARSRWRLDPAERGGEELAFNEARQELEQAEAAFVSGTRDAAAVRLEAPEAARRARAAAERLPPGVRDAALRWAGAQEAVLGRMTALGEASPPEQSDASRAYQAAKVDALVALADYFAALAAR
jgi:hypothetical protein